MSEPASAQTRCGFVAVVGRPNVGKSTLINALVGRKVSITTPKPQTTRHRVLGIRTDDSTQILFVDTPGLHTGAKRTFNRMLNRTAADSLLDVDLAIWVVAGTVLTAEDEAVLDKLKQAGAPVGLVVNKIDHIKRMEDLLPHLAKLAELLGEQLAFSVPVSATRKKNLDGLLGEITQRMPESPFYYRPDQHTDRGEHFQAAELIREQLYMALDQELPYVITVEIERDAMNDDGQRELGAVIWVAEQRHKAIVIGKGGGKLKQVGTAARKRLKAHFGIAVHLELWCRVKSGWADDERALSQLGYDLPTQ